MNKNKIDNSEVPKRLTDWLILMGYPLEKVPESEKIAQMCIGQYYMIWRNLIQHVQPKDIIHKKRMQVFCNDFMSYKKKIQASGKMLYKACDVPEEISLWKERNILTQKVADAEKRVLAMRNKFKDATDKVSSKATQSGLSRGHLDDLKRRVWLLQRLSAELQTKLDNIKETKSIADSLCLSNNDKDVKTKLDKFVAVSKAYNHISNNSTSSVSSAHSTTGDTPHNDLDILLESLSKCHGAEVWSEFCERRSNLLETLSTAIDTHHSGQAPPTDSSIPQTVLFHTTTLQCTLGLETIKNKIQIKQLKRRCEEIIPQLNCEDTELIAERAEHARSCARAAAILSCRDQLAGKRGVFEAEGFPAKQSRQRTPAIHPITKKNDLKKLVCQLSEVEKKMAKMRDCLVTTFGAFSKMPIAGYKRFTDIQFELPKDKVPLLCQYYNEKINKQKNTLDISLDLGVSDCSIDVSSDKGGNETFTDELRLYLTEFNLEKNRKLVLDNGTRIWIGESIQESLARFLTICQENNTACSLVSPSVTLAQTIKRCVDDLEFKIALELLVVKMETPIVNFDCFSNNLNLNAKKEESLILDKIKKRISECLNSLQKVDATLGLVQENLTIWSRNDVKNYVSSNRVVNGKPYKQHENHYIEMLKCLQK